VCKNVFYSIDDTSIALPPAISNLLQEYMDVFPSEIYPLDYHLSCLQIFGLVPPITRSRARQLNLQVCSTLVNCVSELMLGAMDVLIIRYLGEDQQGLGKGQGVEEEQQGWPQQEGDQV
jgi:hypothetical protein